ncbi:hypothetical protein WISP_66901 [Willisornis vidua]|uniref:Uncharacterized protein n=1 Tax=Willisornis vidua TaxID=1566151 RepID=A0ABQ9DDE4_9PASS|nr:hypothetical protein WISP_66901 [Willisornis vidua]
MSEVKQMRQKASLAEQGPSLGNKAKKEGSIWIKCPAQLDKHPVVILTNQITTSLSNGPAIQADLVSPADDLSLSEVESVPQCFSGKKTALLVVANIMRNCTIVAGPGTSGINH